MATEEKKTPIVRVDVQDILAQYVSANHPTWTEANVNVTYSNSKVVITGPEEDN